MRAREFTINIPINIKLNGDGEPDVEIDGEKEVDPSELDQNPVFVSPLQQDLELKKASVGKKSDVIDDLTQHELTSDDEDISEDDEINPSIYESNELERLLQLIK